MKKVDLFQFAPSRTEPVVIEAEGQALSVSGDWSSVRIALGVAKLSVAEQYLAIDLAVDLERRFMGDAESGQAPTSPIFGTGQSCVLSRGLLEQVAELVTSQKIAHRKADLAAPFYNELELIQLALVAGDTFGELVGKYQAVTCEKRGNLSAVVVESN